MTSGFTHIWLLTGCLVNATQAVVTEGVVVEGIYQAGIPSDTNTGQEPKRRASEGRVANDTNIRWQKKIHEGVTIVSL